MSLNPAHLDKRIRLERSIETKNEFNEPVLSWVLIAEVWAGIRPLRGNERFRAMQVQADSEVPIFIRWSPNVDDLSTRDRAVFGSRVYDIKAVINVDMRNEEIQIKATEHL